ncbi:ImmA/IrrE family metallo-endopeptidase [uncultured Dialister sp.]|uniref:ImmA/IrrE family metallo-endopeptidase n=1 Tax=uncultured Dialister sp. TaxID=278064 RepID=UPI00261CDA4D|nr:ImmA/IrrE family metallo-endopeptidase [uncultured Dialister sp.]
MYKADPISRSDVRHYVRKLRKRLGYENILYIPIVEIMENILPLLIPDFNYEIVEKSKMGNKHGETDPDHHLIRIREDVYKGACNGNGRDRFTIAHEIGHLLFHQEMNITLCRVEGNNKERPKVYEDPEWQADVFAGELLAPSYLIREMTALKISESAQISMAAAKTQLRHIPNKQYIQFPERR